MYSSPQSGPRQTGVGLQQADANDLLLPEASMLFFMIRFVHLMDRLERLRALREAARVSNGKVVEYRSLSGSVVVLARRQSPGRPGWST